LSGRATAQGRQEVWFGDVKNPTSQNWHDVDPAVEKEPVAHGRQPFVMAALVGRYVPPGPAVVRVRV
jgi:hypothetical protein